MYPAWNMVWSPYTVLIVDQCIDNCHLVIITYYYNYCNRTLCNLIDLYCEQHQVHAHLALVDYLSSFEGFSQYTVWRNRDRSRGLFDHKSHINHLNTTNTTQRHERWQDRNVQFYSVNNVKYVIIGTRMRYSLLFLLCTTVKKYDAVAWLTV